MNDGQALELVASALSYTIYTTRRVTLCISLGISERLFELLEADVSFRVLTSAFQAICSLVADASMDAVSYLLELGFGLRLEQFISGMCRLIPYQIIDSLDNIRILLERGGDPEWLAVFSEPVLELLLHMSEDQRKGPDADLFSGYSVDEFMQDLMVLVDELTGNS
jgi:hypothetical protein